MHVFDLALHRARHARATAAYLASMGTSRRLGVDELRRLVREELHEAAQGDPKRAALDAFMAALGQAFTADAGRGMQDKVQRSLDNLRSRIEPMVADVSRFLGDR